MAKCKAFALSVAIFLLALCAGMASMGGWTVSLTPPGDWSSAYARARDGLTLWLGSVLGSAFVYIYLRIQSYKKEVDMSYRGVRG